MKFMDFFKDVLAGLSETLGPTILSILGALLVLLIGWFIAKGLSGTVRKILNKTDLDNKIFRTAPGSMSVEKFISKLVYYIVMLITLLIVLDMLGVDSVLDPIKGMVQQFLGAIPSIIKAGIIGFAGYLIANIVSELLGFAGGSLDKFSERMGLSNSIDLGKLVKQLVFILIFVPVLILALDELGMKAISDPAKNLLNTLMGAIPKILTAGIILTVFYFVGKFITGFLKELLSNFGVNEMSQKMGISTVLGKTNLSSLIGNIFFAFLMFTGIIQSVEILEFSQMSGVLRNLLDMTGGIFFGLVILAVGNWISTMAATAVNDNFMKSIVRVATMGLFVAIALRTMGIANDIVNLAFGLILGAVAVAIALSFGLGGREAAGKQMEHILSKFRKN